VRQSNESRQVYRLEAGGPPVGLLPGSLYAHGSLTLEPGDLLVLITDGVSESMNSDDEEWGEERLIELARTCEGLPAVEAMWRPQRVTAGNPSSYRPRGETVLDQQVHTT
jgi:serine phosphatase RsbU (regulator of sigma subunit)